MALAQGKRTSMGIVFILGIVGASLFYGDAVLTPAISVLSAVEGLKLVTPVFTPFVIPITIAILFLLFAMQNRGTSKVAALFGPVTALWFLAIAALGAWHIVDDFAILLAFNPINAIGFTLSHGWTALFVLGSVFLVLTGAEALYADMGHFGRKPIRAAWLAFVLPALALNYLGQGAYVLHYPEGADNPFFRMTPEWALMPMVALATAATVIASQAVITGAFSLTRQAIQLGMLPRMEIRHTSADLSGQIYLPHVNRLLLIGVVLLVLLFETSSNLASAYGIAVAGTMLVETLLAFVYVRRVRQWTLPLAAAVVLPFLFIDLVFVVANGLKLGDGGYAPVLLARGDHPADLELGAGIAAAAGQAAAGERRSQRPRHHGAEQEHPPGAGHRRLPDQQRGRRALGADAQPQAQQGSACAELHRHRAYRRHAPGGSRQGAAGGAAVG